MGPRRARVERTSEQRQAPHSRPLRAWCGRCLARQKTVDPRQLLAPGNVASESFGVSLCGATVGAVCERLKGEQKPQDTLEDTPEDEAADGPDAADGTGSPDSAKSADPAASANAARSRGEVN